MGKTFNIYCDESCHVESDHKDYMFLASIKSAYNELSIHTENIKEIKKKHNFYGEIKWTSVSKSKLHFYNELIDYFFTTDLSFRCVGVRKPKIRNDDFGQSYDEFYYKMYYILLNHDINSAFKYNVYLDIKDTLSANKVKKLREILNTKYGVFRNVQNIRSNESLLLQITDLLMGAVSYENNNSEKENLAKVELIKKIERNINTDIKHTNYSTKFNIFFINLQ